MTRVIIVGAGGHGQVVADVLSAAAQHGATVRPVGYVDDDSALVGRRFGELTVLGRLDALTQIPHEGIVVAIGDNAIRRSVFERLESQGEQPVVARHPSSIVADTVRIGRGTMICAGVIVNVATSIGSNVILNTGCSIDHHNDIGDHVHIAPGVRCGGDVTIGTETLVGIGAIVMPGCSVGAASVVGAAACVTKPIPSGQTVVGIPARPFVRRGGTA